MCLISIVVPVYNAEESLNKCIESILNQTYSNFELILVNDGSTDQSKLIIDEYANKDQRVFAIHKENGGVSSARNAGINSANGKFLLFCDSDDYVENNWCEELYRKINIYPNSFICSNLFKLNGELKVLCETTLDLDNVDYYSIYINGVSPYTVNKIYNLDIIKKNRIYFDEKIQISEDVLFNLEYFSQTDKNCFLIAKPLYYYVNNENSAMNRYHSDMLGQHLAPFYLRLPYIDKKYISEYCDRWLYIFLTLFKNVFDSRNNMSFFEKMKYNQIMINSKEFVYCINNASGKNENPALLKLYKTKNYYLVWIFERIISLKNKIRRR